MASCFTSWRTHLVLALIPIGLSALSQRAHSYEHCDSDLETLKIKNKLALFFSRKKITELDQVYQSPEPSTGKLIQIGPIWIEVSKADPTPIDLNDWDEYSFGWGSLYQDFLKLQTEKIDQTWTDFYYRYNSLIEDDEERKKGSNFEVGVEHAPLLKQSIDELSSCLPLNCSQEVFSKEVIEFLRSITLYRSLLDQVSYFELLEDLILDLAPHQFILNPTIRRESERILILPLVAGPFEKDKKRLADFIEAIWTSPELQVKIEWVKEDEASPDIFKFVTTTQGGGRSNVDFVAKEIHIFPKDSTFSISHEVGHALGFYDLYSEIWNPSTCEYLVKYQPDDLMSGSSTGRVTPEEWKTLQEFYPHSVHK